MSLDLFSGLGRMDYSSTVGLPALPSGFVRYTHTLLYLCLSGTVRSVAVCAGPAGGDAVTCI